MGNNFFVNKSSDYLDGTRSSSEYVSVNSSNQLAYNLRLIRRPQKRKENENRR